MDEPEQTFEGMCLDIEGAYVKECNELLCECCRGEHSFKCAACVHARGWHTCDKDRTAMETEENPEMK